MDDVLKMQQDAQLVMALKQEAAAVVLDRIGGILSADVTKLLCEDLPAERVVDLVMQARGVVRTLNLMGYDAKKMIDHAAREAVKRQVNVTRLPPSKNGRPYDERDTERQAEYR